jgi:hypothetical protein
VVAVVDAGSWWGARTVGGMTSGSANGSASGTGGGILGGPVEGAARLAASYPAVEATPGIRVLHRGSGFVGTLVTYEGTHVVLRSPSNREKRFANQLGAFAVDGSTIRFVAPSGADDRSDVAPHLVDARVTDDRTASGSLAVVGARARVARAGRILVEGIHDAELVEQVWGDDLRLEGVVVERLDGADHLGEALVALRPGPGRRVGVLLDHLVAGSKEARLADAVAQRDVLVTGTPYVDVWEAVRPAVVGIDRWPHVPRGTDWKTGVCAALGYDDPRALWRHVRASVRSWKDLEQPLVRAVEELIDFVTVE